MTVVQFKNRPDRMVPFNNLLSDLLPQNASLFRDDLGQVIPVNIKETEKDFVVEIVAPGLNKEDFKVNLENNTLTVSVEKNEEQVAENEKVILKEYKTRSFKRSFTIGKKINDESISAQYVNGVLTLNLPKKEEVKPATKQISIQ